MAREMDGRMEKKGKNGKAQTKKRANLEELNIGGKFGKSLLYLGYFRMRVIEITKFHYGMFIVFYSLSTLKFS